MRRIIVLILVALLLGGCGRQETFETLNDEYLRPVMVEQRRILVDVDEDALVLQGQNGTAYLCDGYSVTTQVLSAGNLNGTVKTLTGFEADELTVMQTASVGYSRYACAWSASSESGVVVGKAVILDDGMYHYCITVIADAAAADTLQEVMDSIFDSVTLA